MACASPRSREALSARLKANLSGFDRHCGLGPAVFSNYRKRHGLHLLLMSRSAVVLVGPSLVA
jgi:hypothetical protein